MRISGKKPGNLHLKSQGTLIRTGYGDFLTVPQPIEEPRKRSWLQAQIVLGERTTQGCLLATPEGLPTPCPHHRASPAWRQWSHRWSCSSSRSLGRTARSSSSSAGPQMAHQLRRGRGTALRPRGAPVPMASVAPPPHLWPHAVGTRPAPGERSFSRAGQRDGNLVPGEGLPRRGCG